MGSTPIRSPRPGGGQCTAKGPFPQRQGPCAVRGPPPLGHRGMKVGRAQCAILLSMVKLLLGRFIGGCFKSHSSDRAIRVTTTFWQLPMGSMGRCFSSSTVAKADKVQSPRWIAILRAAFHKNWSKVLQLLYQALAPSLPYSGYLYNTEFCRLGRGFLSWYNCFSLKSCSALCLL